MKIYKFGGASIATPSAMKNLFPIISDTKKPLIVVVSAFGKTTNALEKIVNAANGGNKELAQTLLLDIELAHNNYAIELLGENGFQALLPQLQEFYTEIQWAIDDGGIQNKNYVYDQIVSIGELLSTTLFSAFLNQNNLQNTWLDARDFIKTDNNYRDANVDMELSEQSAQKIIRNELNKTNIIITQGFIGCTDENASTTLGREGSDYSAALLASFLNAEDVTIWKDVKGLYNADPRLFPNAVQIPEISYFEVVEMAYYGAQVIHPKTIKPLQNKRIPLYVKCFLDKTLPGSCIKAEIDAYQYPPIIVVKKQQVMLNIQSRDFSFITEDNIGKIYSIFAQHQTRINMIQNSAINLKVGVNNDADKIKQIVAQLDANYVVHVNENVEIVTIRHYNDAIVSDVLRGKIKLVEQKTSNTFRAIVQ
jgi:aspartate kinase